MAFKNHWDVRAVRVTLRWLRSLLVVFRLSQSWTEAEVFLSAPELFFRVELHRAGRSAVRVPGYQAPMRNFVAALF